MAHNISDQRNNGPNHYSDMKIGVIGRGKVDERYLSKLDEEYAKLSSKQAHIDELLNSSCITGCPSFLDTNFDTSTDSEINATSSS